MRLLTHLLDANSPDLIGYLGALIDKYGKDFAELVIVIWAFITGRIAPGYILKDAWAKRDQAMDIAEGLAHTGEAAVEVAKKATSRAGTR